MIYIYSSIRYIMPVKYSRESTNEDYINFLKELGVIDNIASNEKS